MIAVRGLLKSFGPVHALAGITLEVWPGEIVGLLGPNGAGKTTTVECVVGLNAPDAGTIVIGDADVRAQPRVARQRLGVALQGTSLQDGITPREALQSFAALFPAAVAVAPLLQRFGLQDQADMRFHTLSAGQRQRLVLALALVNDPAAIVLDEPTVGLDVPMRREFHAHLRALRDESRAILLTTHDMDEAAQLCDRIVVIAAGRIIASGTPGELIAARSGAMRVQVTLDRAFDVVWLNPGTWFTDVHCLGNELAFTTADMESALARLLVLLDERGLRILRLTAGRGTLEDAIHAMIAARSPR